MSGDVLEQTFDIGRMLLLTPNHSLRIRSGPEALSSITIFEKCGVTISSSEGQAY